MTATDTLFITCPFCDREVTIKVDCGDKQTVHQAIEMHERAIEHIRQEHAPVGRVFATTWTGTLLHIERESVDDGGARLGLTLCGKRVKTRVTRRQMPKTDICRRCQAMDN